MEFLELIESIRSDEATRERLFKGDGIGVRAYALHKDPKYPKALAEAAKFVALVVKGKRSMRDLQEAMTTSDFPLLFGDILDRQLLAAYQEAPYSWSAYAKRSVVRDFREVKRFSVYGADQTLEEVPEKGEYKASKIEEGAPYSYAVKKYGRKLPFSFETIVNDDLEALTDAPARLGRAARRSEEKFVTSLYVDENGPHASFYSTAKGNVIEGNPPLSLAALQTAMETLSKRTDESGEPIIIETFELVIPPALEVTALNYLNALQIELNEKGGTSGRKLVSTNWVKTRFNLSLNYYIPVVAKNANSHTSWFCFANPSNGRPALEVGFLRGYEEPQVFMKQPNAARIGGGADEYDFDTDSREYKVRHIFGGTRMDPKMTLASKGTG